jgi:Xaa-Pro aminopeptidase
MLERRLQAVRRHLEASKLDALLVSHLPHVRYLTGFTGSNGLCIISRRKQFFLTDNRYRHQSKDEVRGFRIFASSASLVEMAVRSGILSRARRIGFEAQYVSVSFLRDLKKRQPRKRFVPAYSVIERISALKDEREIDAIRRAVEITDKVFRKVLRAIKPGVTEMDIAAEIGYWHRRYGSDGDAFEPIVASGPRGALPHARPSKKKIRKGELVTLDLGCRVDGYHSDLTRTVAVGSPSVRAKKIYHVVLEAQRMAIEAAKAGVSARLLDAIARSHIRRSGFGRFFSHSLGHGLGIEIHEPLRLSATSKEILQDGNVVTVEPGIYIPGFGGVRIEDDIVVRQDHCEVLNRASKELIVL